MWLDYAFVTAGFGALLVAGYGKVFYYGDEYSTSDKRAPTWFGKLMFLVVGISFIALGMLDLFGVIAMGRE